MSLPNIKINHFLDIKPYSYHREFVSLILPQKAAFLPIEDKKFKKLDISLKVTQVEQNRIFLLPLKNSQK
jgi:hypothetical protein